MVRHRVRVTRIIAAIVTFALSTQVTEAQAVNCITMSGTHANDDHSGMMQHQHRADAAGSATTRSGSSHSSGTAACNQTMLCANVAAVPPTAMRASHFDNGEPPISFGPGVLQARTLRPDPPPPRI